MPDDQQKNEHAAALGALGAAKGGQVRANRLTAEERREIARHAAEARWAKEDVERLPRAICGSPDRPLRIGNIELQAYVLQDGTRVLSQAGFLEALGRHRKANVRREGGEERIPAILQGKAINPFISKDILEKSRPIRFRTPTGAYASGYRADLLPEVCEVYLQARDAGVLPKNQEHVAKQAEILIRGLANVGIIALVDEATGYQEVRARNALAEVLEKFVAKELRKWVRTFPNEFYKEMFRLKEWEYSEENFGSSRPRMAGKLTDDIVYKRLAPGVREELRRLIPRNEKGRLKYHLHRRLTEDIGHPKLKEHLAVVVVLMQLAKTWGEFVDNLNRFRPKFGSNFPLPLKAIPANVGDGPTT